MVFRVLRIVQPAEERLDLLSSLNRSMKSPCIGLSSFVACILFANLLAVARAEHKESDRHATAGWAENLSLVISECMANNANTLETRVRANTNQAFAGDSITPDWIEIHNAGTNVALLDGCCLTNELSSPRRWRFPSEVAIPPGGYLVVFASGLNLTDPAIDEMGYLHTNFRLDKLGGDLALVDADGVAIHVLQGRPEQFEDVSYGVPANNAERSTPRFYANPTPGEANPVDVPSAPKISVTSRSFTDSLKVEIVGERDSDQIYYTLDERKPTKKSHHYTQPIEINSTTNLRAISVSKTGNNSVVTSAAYVKFGLAEANSETHLPILIVETFGDSISRDQFGDDFVAIIEPGDDGVSKPTDSYRLSTRAGVKIRGSSSATFSKKQYRVEFRDENRKDRKLPVLGMPKEADWVFYGPNHFDRALISNPLMFDLSNQIGRYATRTRWVEAYFNSRYQGVYAITEVIERGSDRVDVESLSTGKRGVPVHGGFVWKHDHDGSVYVDPERLNTRQRGYIDSAIDDLTKAASEDFRDPKVGYAAHADVDSFIDYSILNLLAMKVDALRSSSYYFKTNAGKLQAGPIWDFDRSMTSTDSRDDDPCRWHGTRDSTNYFSDTERILPWWNDMFQDPDFVSQYIDRWYELRKNKLSLENINATIDKHADMLGEAADRDYRRWSRSRYDDFAGEIRELKTWLQRRVEWIDSQWMPPPASDTESDRVPVGTHVNIEPGDPASTVYYMSDGTDPRNKNGVIHPGARVLSGPITIDKNTHLVVRRYRKGFGGDYGYVRSGDDWSAPLRIVPQRNPATAANLAITEIHYNPKDANVLGGEKNARSDEFEFLEFTNVSAEPIELEGMQLVQQEIDSDTQGVRFLFAAQTLSPGESIVVVENVKAFRSRYGNDSRVALGTSGLDSEPGEYGGKLSNRGEWIILQDSNGSPIRRLQYDDEWFRQTDGQGYSLVNRKPTDVNNEALSRKHAWQPSEAINGTPGLCPHFKPTD